MSTSSKNKFGRYIILAALAFGVFARGWAAIGSVSVSLDPNVRTFTAGVPTETIWLLPDTTEYSATTISLELLSGGKPVAGGISPTSFSAPIPGPGGSTQYTPLNPAMTLYYAGTNLRLRATIAGIAPALSSTFTVIANVPSTLLVLTPGMHVPESPADTPGSPTAQNPNTEFPFGILMTDAFNNLITTANNLLTIDGTPADDFSLISASSTLSNGIGSGSAKITQAKVTVRIRATAGSVQGFTDIGSNGPPENEVFAGPSPFNPKKGKTITFQYRLTSTENVTLKVTDQFGNQVWEQGVNSVPGFNRKDWDGKNGKGDIVAAGVYYILLDVGGSIKSKKRFGVVK